MIKRTTKGVIWKNRHLVNIYERYKTLEDADAMNPIFTGCHEIMHEFLVPVDVYMPEEERNNDEDEIMDTISIGRMFE